MDRIDLVDCAGSFRSPAGLSHRSRCFSRRNSDMSANGWLQFAIYSLILLLTVRPVGIYMARVLEGERTWLDPVLRPFERLIYKLCGVNARKGDELARVRLRHARLLGRQPGAHLRHRAPAGTTCPGTRSIWPPWDPTWPGTPPPALPPTPTGSSTRPNPP